MTTIESILTREFDLRFIDAHALATEAKLSLDIIGYPTPEQVPALHLEAERLFYSKPSQERSNLRQMNLDFEAMKQTAHSLSSSIHASDDGEGSVTSSLVSRSSSTKRNTKGSPFRSLFRSSRST